MFIKTYNAKFSGNYVDGNVNSDAGEPKTDDEVLNGPERDWWIPVCIALINNFLNRGSWKFVPREAVRKLNRKLIKTKMILKKKNETDGSTRYKARCVSKGLHANTLRELYGRM